MTKGEAGAIGDATCFRPGPNVHSRTLDDEVIVLDFARGEYFALDAVGAVMWQQIERGACLREMAMLLHARYDVSEDQASRDVTALVEELLAHALILVV